VHHTLLEDRLVRARGWLEFTAYPLFSPQSLIAEGGANLGIEVAFPGSERLAFEREVLFPLAGLDPALAAVHDRVQALAERLSYAGNEAARRLLDGRIDARQAAAWLERHSLMSRARAEQRVRFIQTYRSYVINYTVGKDLVRRYVETRAAADPAPGERRWAELERLFSTPLLPSDLAAEAAA
jgi:hypothetical protein